MKNVLSKVRNKKKQLYSSLMALMVLALPVVSSATEPTEQLNLNFDMTQFFTWAQMIIDVMMPILYITLGISLGFIVIRALKNAFN